MRLSEVPTEREADGASVRLSGALGRGAHRDEEEKEAGSDDMATIQTSSQVEDVSASTCSPTLILEATVIARAMPPYCIPDGFAKPRFPLVLRQQPARVERQV